MYLYLLDDIYHLYLYLNVQWMSIREDKEKCAVLLVVLRKGMRKVSLHLINRLSIPAGGKSILACTSKIQVLE